MKNSYKYSLTFLPLVLLFNGGYLGLNSYSILNLPFENVKIILISSLLIFFLGTLIIAPGLTKSAENFTGRFLILTTAQMLGLLSIIMAIVYLDIAAAKKTGFHLLTLFIILLFIQSYLLIIYKKKKTS
jgi:hypothetical protein